MKKYIVSFARGTVIMLGVFSLLVGTNPALAAIAAPAQAAQITEEFSEQRFLELTNEYRLQTGAQPLAINSQLEAAAVAKATDMIKKGYWDHFRPSDHKAPWDFIEENGYSYKVAGENLARGYSTPEGIVRAWMASPSHRANVLSKQYREMGIACVRVFTPRGQSYLLTVQMFGAK